MAILKQREYIPYILNILNKAEYKTLQELYQEIGQETGLTEDDKNILTNSDPKESKYKNIIRFTRSLLNQQKLIESIDKGVYQITEKGKQFLLESGSDKLIDDVEKQSADETLEEENNSNVILATADYYESVEFDILDRLKNLGTNTVDKGNKFENICLKLLQKMGYGTPFGTGKPGDKGVDGFLTTDVLGVTKVGIQCKCYQKGNNISREDISIFVGGLQTRGIDRGIYITTSDFTKDAVECTKDTHKNIILINGVKLAQFMREYQIGVEVIETNFVYDIIIGEDN